MKRAHKGAKGARPPEDLEQELSTVRSDLREVEEGSNSRRYVVNDSTTEKLGELLKANPQGLLLERDELAGWLQALERQDRRGDREFFLEAWNGDRGYTYDRIGRGTIEIEALCLSIIGGIQPAKLARFVSEAVAGGYAADGLLQRFQILVWPEDSPDWKLVDRGPAIEIEERVRHLFRTLDALQQPAEEPRALHFSTEAQQLFNTWLTELERRIRSPEMETCPAFESHLAKYRSMMPSLALIFHHIEAADFAQPVSSQAAALAANWCDFLEGHARKVYAGELNLDLASAHALLKKLRSGSIANGTTLREISKNGWTHLKKSGQVQSALQTLEEHNWARLETIRPGAAGGRPSSVLVVNPAVSSLAS